MSTDDPHVRRPRHAQGPRRGAGLALLVPSAVIFVAFFFYPLYRLVYLGLHQQNRFGTAERYVGSSQYTDVLTGERVPRRPAHHGPLRAAHGAPRPGARRAAGRVAANRRLRGIKVFQTIFAHGRHARSRWPRSSSSC